MAQTLQHRRGNTAEVNSTAGAEGEIFMDTTKNTLVVMDGTTTGGHVLARLDDIPTNISEFANDAGFITVSSVFSGDYNDLTNLPSLFDGDYNSLTNRPTIPSDVLQLTDNANTLFSGSYSDLTDAPTLATVATSGAYTDLSGKPTIPAAVSELSNDSNFITLANISVGTDASPFGSGGIDFNSASGIFTYIPPNLASYITSVSNDLNPSLGGNLNVNGYTISSASGDVVISPSGSTNVIGNANITGTLNSHSIPGGSGTIALTSDIPDAIQGVQGVTGSGSQGVQGIAGDQGVQGLTGSGNQGVQGLTGEAGSNGSNGAQGVQGLTGSAGDAGAQGVQGLTGSAGDSGLQGLQGLAGPDSYTPSTPGDWANTAPTTVSAALDRLATLVKALNGGTGA